MNNFTRQLLVLFAILGLTLPATAQSGIAGNWVTQDRNTHVQIYQHNGKFYGKITWTKDGTDAQGKSVLDTQNPDKTLRKNPIIGLVFLRDFIYQRGGWNEGTIYDPESGKVYAGELSLLNDNLHVKGKFLFFSRTEIWHRLP